LSIDKERILGIAQRYILKGQSKKAIKELQKLVEDSPTDSRLRLKLGDIYLKNGENENAIREFLKVAELYVEEDLSLRAISIYKKVLSINPNYIEALHEMAKLYIKEGLEGSAKNCYQTILKMRPDDAETLSALEGINHRQQPKEVSKPDLRDFSNSHAHPPFKPSIPQGKPASSSQGAGELSIPPGESADKPPFNKDAEMHYHLAIAYKEMDLFDYAITEFEMASEELSIRFDCSIMIGTCYMERGDYGKAIEYYKTASQIKGLSGEKLAHLHFSLGLAYEANGMVSEALDTFRLVLKIDQSHAEALEKIEKLQQSAK
jgi:tetratricopeptide (TPR) repeat protein